MMLVAIKNCVSELCDYVAKTYDIINRTTQLVVHTVFAENRCSRVMLQ